MRRARRSPAGRPQQAADFGVERLQRQPRIAQQSLIRGVILVEVGFVQGRMDEYLARGNGRGQEGAREARTDAQNAIRLLQRCLERSRARVRARAYGQRMGLGKGALAGQGRHDRGLQQIRQRRQFGAGLGIEHALSRVQQRQLGLAQQRGRAARVIGIRAVTHGRRRGVVERGTAFSLPDVRRHFQHNGARFARAQ